MQKLIGVFIAFYFLVSCTAGKAIKEDSWIPLFDGKTLAGWKASENPATFKVENGMIVVNGPRAHLFYDGPVLNHDFKDFEFQAQVMTTPGSNSGIFIHTQYQENGWPSKGYEVQVNNSQTDWRRTGSLYGIDDVKEVYVKDNEWYTQTITVKGSRIVVRLNDKTVVDYTEPEKVKELQGRGEKYLTSGTFALQGHDPASKVFYKDIKVKAL